MKCPNCGAPMKEGQLYCEHCGEEIQIVPEFEPEIENSIHSTLSNVATEITAPREQPEQNLNKKEWTKFHSLGRKKRNAFILASILILAACIFAGINLIRFFQPGYQYDTAVSCMKKKQYEAAAVHFERAVVLSPNNVSYLNGLAGCYYSMGLFDDAETVCLETVDLEGSNETAYRCLVSIYEKRGAYDQINKLMQSCKDHEIRTRYSDYMANPPEFDPEGGTYRQKLNIKLIGNAAGNIYYTTDGSEPDESGTVYTKPISLESGGCTIKAFFVNRYGVRSETVTQTYYVDVIIPEAPEVSPQSGIYGTPGVIQVEVPRDCKVYYTTDRTDPGTESTLYEGAIPMPVGYSTFRFVVCSPGGVLGETTECHYTLSFKAALSMEAASNQLLLTLKNAGMILNLQGDLPDKGGHNLYTYKYALTINGHNYYLYREYYEEAAGTSNATGNDYVVNYMSGECYRAVIQKDRTFKLYTIGEPEEDTAKEES